MRLVNVIFLNIRISPTFCEQYKLQSKNNVGLFRLLFHSCKEHWGQYLLYLNPHKDYYNYISFGLKVFR